jgi:hypothetical protein
MPALRGGRSGILFGESPAARDLVIFNLAIDSKLRGRHGFRAQTASINAMRFQFNETGCDSTSSDGRKMIRSSEN